MNTVKWLLVSALLVGVAVLNFLLFRKSKALLTKEAELAATQAALSVERSSRKVLQLKEKYYAALKKNKALLGLDADFGLGTLITFYTLNDDGGTKRDDEPSDDNGETGSVPGDTNTLH